MKILSISRIDDFDISIDSKFDICFKNKETGLDYSFPTILKDKVDIEIPESNYNIIDFMNKRKKKLKNQDVFEFMKLINTNVTSYMWELMKIAKIDIFFDKEFMYVADFTKSKYIVFNNRNIDFKVFDRLYRRKFVTDKSSLYFECREELYGSVREKLSNAIAHNEIVNMHIKNFKSTLKELEDEFVNPNFSFIKILFLYESLIRMKENYLNENHCLLPLSVIKEIEDTLAAIRGAVLNKRNVSVNRSC